METQQLFATFIDERTTSLIGRIDKAERKRSDERIRRLRVGLKRWRTVYRLITVLLPHQLDDSKVEQAVHRLFKRAGKLRDFQQSRELLAGLDLPPKLNKHVDHWLKKREKKARKRLRKAIEAFHTKRLRKISRFIGDHSKAIRQARVRLKLHQLMKHEAHVITILQQNNPSVEQLHSIRKSLKSLIEQGNVLVSVTQNNAL
ncbi:MAG: CHAD domain-containing protein, partial [Cytophagaceae bacterium]